MPNVSVPSKCSTKSNINTTYINDTELIEALPLKSNTSHDDLINLLTENQCINNVNNEDVISKRGESAKYGRRSINDSAKSRLPRDLFLNLENDLENSSHNFDSPFELMINSERRTSRCGRLSQPNLGSRISSTISDSLSLYQNLNLNVNNPNETVLQITQQNKRNENFEEEFLTMLPNNITKSDNLIVKNSVRYGRRAGKNNHVDTNKTKVDVQNLSDNHFSNKLCEKKDSILENTNYSEISLEESWKSLKVFNKKHKGRISESKH